MNKGKNNIKMTFDDRNIFFHQLVIDKEYSKQERLQLLGKVVPYLPLKDNYCTDGLYEIPIVPSYNNDIPNDFIPFDKLLTCKHRENVGVHFYVSDNGINRFINNPYRYLYLLRQHPCVIAPDCSIYSNMWRAVNVGKVFLARNTNCFLVENHVKTIPCFTYATIDTIDLALLGIPKGSVVAVGNHTIGRSHVCQEITEYAIKRLVEEKQPSKLLVYGFPLSFEVDIEVINVYSRIQELRSLHNEKEKFLHTI